MERWKKIPASPEFSVSNQGRVRKDAIDRMLTLSNVCGHLAVYLREDGRQVKKYVAHLVAAAFLEPHRSHRDTTLIHLNGNLLDCHADNLRWRPRWFALKYTSQFRTMRDQGLMPIRDVDTGEEYENAWELIIREGLLLNDIKRSINENSVAWPSMHRYEWIEER